MNVLAIVRMEFNVDDHRMYLMGHSQGGAGALHIADTLRRASGHADAIYAGVAVFFLAIRPGPDSPEAIPASLASLAYLAVALATLE